MSKVPIGDYTLSAFKPDFSDGNLRNVSIRFFNEVVKGDIVFRGGQGTVTGHVFDDDGVTPLKAKVAVSGDRVVIAGGLVGTAFQYAQYFNVADTNFTTGQYSFGGLFVGDFSVSAAGQFSPDPITLPGNIPSPGATVQLDMKLQATSVISGVVFQPDGVTPVKANVVVSYKSDAFKLICSEGGDGEQSCTAIPQGIQEENTVTDASGHFLLPLVNAGTFTITATDQSNGKTAQIHGAVKAGETANVSARLVGLGQITVHVLGSDTRTVIPGAKVVVSQLGYPNKKMTVSADGTGTVVLGGGDSFSEGAFLAVATDVRNGFTGRASGTITKDGDLVSVNVFLYDAVGTVSGLVFRPDGITPVPNADVVISSGSTGTPLAFIVTDANGAFSEPFIPLGPFTVDVFEAASARHGVATGRVDLNGQQVAVTINEAALGVVRGTVLQSGPLTPLKGWVVSVSQTGFGLPTLQTTSSIDGTFSVPGVSQGPVGLTARSDGVNGSGSATSRIDREGQVVDVPLLVNIVRPLFGTVVGRVFNPDGSPAVNSAIDVCGSGCEAVENGVHITAVDGTFSLTQVPLGRFQVRSTGQTTHNVGIAAGQLSFDGETAGVTVVMVGLSTISGTVFRGDGVTPAGGARLSLVASPNAGCGLEQCALDAAGDGTFTFINVPARTFTLTASDAVSGFKGVVGDLLNPGEAKQVRIVLEPTGSIQGRVLAASGPAGGVVAELVMGPRHLFVQTKNDGTFSFDTTPLGAYTLTLQDPVGSGIARRNGSVAGVVTLGDIVLDEAPPMVATTIPGASATSVPLAQTVRITFSEKVDASTINATNVLLSDGTATVNASLLLTTGDTQVVLTPIAPLKESTRYTLKVSGVVDLVGKPMTAPYVASFTSVDLTPPSYSDVNPAQGASGIPIATTIRLQLSEPIDPTRFSGAPLQLTGPAGAIDGRTDYLFGNTVIVFTPNRPLDQNGAYHVHVQAAADLSGNVQPQALDYGFATTTNIPPTIVSLTASHNGVVTENGTATVTANVATNDIAYVDFSINGTFIFTSHAAPFALSFKAIPAFGKPGDVITISAIATDTSGNRGVVPATVGVMVVADKPPTITITAPADGISAKNGDRITVTIQSADDLGLVNIAAKAPDRQTAGRDQREPGRTRGRPRTRPDDQLRLQHPARRGAEYVDRGRRVGPRHQGADDVRCADPHPRPRFGAAGRSDYRSDHRATASGRVRRRRPSCRRRTWAACSRSRSPSAAWPRSPRRARSTRRRRPRWPRSPSRCPSTATSGQTARLHATAVDAAGNVGTAAEVILPVTDSTSPVLHLSAASGSLEIAPGQSVDIVADASDDIGVASVQLTGTGAFIVNQTKQVTPPLGSAHVVFSILVPNTVVPGTTLTLIGKATDSSANVSAAATLTLTVKSIAGVTLPSSAVVNAGSSIPVTVQLAPPAPANGLRVDFATGNGNVIGVTPFVVFAAGESSKTVNVTGLSGGTTTLTALVSGVQAATMTISVQGGVVDGTVLDSQLHPVVGAQVTVNGGSDIAGDTDGDGHFVVSGVSGPAVTVKAFDPASSRRGFSSATMLLPNGFAHVNVILIQAGLIHGTVLRADLQTPVGPGIIVDIFSTTDLVHALATTGTDANGRYEFPLVTIGNYVLIASATDGEQGKASAAVVASGQEVTVNIGFLGRGSVTGTVLDGGGHPVGNADLSFTSTSIFGSTAIAHPANGDGTFRFDDVPIGTFTLIAHDRVTNRAGTASGSVTADQQVVPVDVHLATFGGVQGIVRRPDGTPVPHATVTTRLLTTTTDDTGAYSFNFLALGSLTVAANEPATRGVGQATTTLTVNAQTLSLDITLLAQGSVVATVLSANGSPVPAASVSIQATNGSLKDFLSGTTGSDGIAVIDHVLIGTIDVSASAGGLQGAAPSTTLSAGELKPVTVTLEATASIAGHVFLPDGQTPADAGTVYVLGSTGFGFGAIAQQPIAPDGSFRFDGIRLGSYGLSAADQTGRTRALIDPVQLVTKGQVVERDLTEVGLGTLTGRVINPDGSSAVGFPVQVHDSNAAFGGFSSATSLGGGVYVIEGLAIGHLDISSGNAEAGLLGETARDITADGQTVNADIFLLSNAITLPVQFVDGNNYQFDLQPSGAVNCASSCVFGAFDAGGAAKLDVIVNGQSTPFTGDTIAVEDTRGRQIVVKQEGIAGLNVTRKVFVPRDGYFGRYVEILENPTSAPITATVHVQSHIRGSSSFNAPPQIVTTSSNDQTLNVSDAASADRYVVVDDNLDGDSTQQGNLQPIAWIFDGAGAADRVGDASFTTTISCPFFCNTAGHVSYEWDNVTVPVHGRVARMSIPRPGIESCVGDRGGEAPGAAAAGSARRPQPRRHRQHHELRRPGRRRRDRGTAAIARGHGRTVSCSKTTA